MRFEVVITPLAEKDIIESHRYYLSKASVKVADSFSEDINRTFDMLEINPFYQIRTKSYRAIPLKNFPFLIFFEVLETQKIVKILRVFNTSLNPKNWP